MSKHTPGPWHTKKSRTDREIQFIVDENNSTVAYAYVHRTREDEGMANTCLIAIAPELIEALERIEKFGDIEGAAKISTKILERFYALLEGES